MSMPKQKKESVSWPCYVRKSAELSTDRVVIDLHVLLILGAGDSPLLAFNDSSMPGVFHIVFCLGQQQLGWRSIQVFLATILKGQWALLNPFYN